MASSAREQHQNIDSLSDPFARNALRVAYHVRKYSVLYVCGALGAIALALFPTYTGSTGGNQSVAEGQGIYGNKGAGGQGRGIVFSMEVPCPAAEPREYRPRPGAGAV